MAAKQIQSVPTKDLYARWAQVYDTDGNILQSIDDHALPTLLNHAFNILPSTPLTITELGSGTGRNTLKLLSRPNISTINALDLSPEMLQIAKSRILSSTTPGSPAIQFLEFDALQPENFPKVKELEGKADLVLSTLVLEHLPIKSFFETVKRLLKPGGVLVLSNMHAEMGRRSRAGFMDGDGGKVQGDSFVYEIGEVVEVGGSMGFQVEGKVGERGVEQGDLENGVVGARGGKWVGCRVWFGCVMRLGG